MKTFIPSASELTVLQNASDMLARGQAMANEAKKLSDAGKASIAAWLLNNRATDISTLLIGETVNVQNVAIVTISSMRKLDEKAFAVAHTALHASFVRPVRVLKYQPHTLI